MPQKWHFWHKIQYTHSSTRHECHVTTRPLRGSKPSVVSARLANFYFLGSSPTPPFPPLALLHTAAPKFSREWFSIVEQFLGLTNIFWRQLALRTRNGTHGRDIAFLPTSPEVWPQHTCLYLTYVTQHVHFIIFNCDLTSNGRHKYKMCSHATGTCRIRWGFTKHDLFKHVTLKRVPRTTQMIL